MGEWYKVKLNGKPYADGNRDYLVELFEDKIKSMDRLGLSNFTFEVSALDAKSERDYDDYTYVDEVEFFPDTIKLEDMGFTKWTYKALKNYGLHTLQDLMDIDDVELRKIRHISKTKYGEVKQIISKFTM